jgi:hypothetical protein
MKPEFISRIEAQRKASLNAKADVFKIGPIIRMAVELSDLPVEDQRALFHAILLDGKVNPGYASLTEAEQRATLKMLDRWCGWSKMGA